jgi:hypothetical protein
MLLPVPVIGSEGTCTRSLAVLIEVPEVNAHPARRGGTAFSRRATNRRPALNRPKRRLRRQVRWAGCALVTLVPLVSLCTLGWSNRPSRILACSISDASELRADPPIISDPRNPSVMQTGSGSGSSGMITLSTDPASAGAGANAQVPVIFPGYVLPDDALEDKAHAGS